MTQCLKPKWVLGMESGPDPRDSRGPYPPPRRDVAKTDASFFRQVVLKINAKLGGSNVIVQGGLPIVEDAPTMVMGIDATHPPPGSSLISIAGVVASMDRECTVYRSGIAIVPPRNDSIPVLDEMTVDLLGLFRLEANVLPERIIVFRDGVSEGAFDRMVAEEVGLIKEAARFVSGKIQQRYEPKITFIAVQKRHHTRFYFGRENSDHKGNAFPGTVVDRGVVHPERFEYYLISHPGLQGTSRPTKYQVLYDENNLSSDQVQALTYRLCFLYARSQRAVSLPSPVYYAHLVADRARCHLRGNDGSDAGSRTGLGEEPELDPMKDELRASGLWFI